MALRIEDYALIGDCETAALVGCDGSVDWLCWPRFDSGACFAALLGTPENGRWLIAPCEPVQRKSRRYRDHTLILETELETASGAVQLVDFMPLRGKNSDLVRIVRGVRGTVRMRAELVFRFDYGRSVPWVTHLEDGTLRAIAGPDMVVLRTPVKLHGEDMKTVAEFDVHEGQSIPFALTYGASWHHLPAPIDPEKELASAEKFWQNWARRGSYKGPYAEAVERSLITLKALTYRPTGGVIAAATTSLPEQLGGPRNWDYRYCWLRDSTFTLLALMNGGYYEEARAWQDWLLRAVAGSPAQIQIMYGIVGERQLAEWELHWLPGYENSKPVRVGNGAASQLQLDIYGEIADALHQARVGHLEPTERGIQLHEAMLKHLESIWHQPDEGIWEVRGPRRDFTYSKVMAWVAFDRAIKSAEHFGLKGPVDHWKRIRQQIHDEVCRKSFNAGLNSFVQYYGANTLDASLLLIPLVGFLPAQDPRVRGTVAAIERRLMRDGYVMRYDTHRVDDGLPPGEGAFLACSFWLADNYVLQGRRDDARRLYERLLALRNDVGLLSEEYDFRAKRLVGNVPQAFSHVALVNTAFNMSKAQEGPIEQRAEGGEHVGAMHE